MTLRASAAALSLAFTLAVLAPAAQAQQTVLPLWPHATPEPAQTTAPEQDVTKPTDALISGHRSARITNVTHPTMAVYPPSSRVANTGAAALVFPGGGYIRLAWDGEGLDACRWLNSIGMTCLLVKYRVPEQGRYPDNPADLEDAQQAMRLARAHAKDWHLNPDKIGVLGFSAGANLAALLSTHPDDAHVTTTPAAPDVNTSIDARPNFALVIYPAYLILAKDVPTIDPLYTPNQFTPPTFLLQAENDRSWGKNAPVYYQALAAANIPAELHMYQTGGHGFGLHPVGRPEEHWTQLATAFLRLNQILPALPATTPTPSGAGLPLNPYQPCPMLYPQSGRPDKSQPPAIDPACW